MKNFFGSGKSVSGMIICASGAIAGYFGLALGVGLLELLNFGLAQSGGDTSMFTNPEVDFNKAMTALVILVISGVFAGMIPAQRAISIKPIDALRDEV